MWLNSSSDLIHFRFQADVAPDSREASRDQEAGREQEALAPEDRGRGLRQQHRRRRRRRRRQATDAAAEIADAS